MPPDVTASKESRVRFRLAPSFALFGVFFACAYGCSVKVPQVTVGGGDAGFTLRSENISLRVEDLFVETSSGRTVLASFTQASDASGRWTGQTTMPDGRIVRVSVTPRPGEPKS